MYKEIGYEKVHFACTGEGHCQQDKCFPVVYRLVNQRGYKEKKHEIQR